jgi:pyruvate/2-oxoglutarate dehydrogenase complex dihydrolipoamide acyltransferase (E2) component
MQVHVWAAGMMGILLSACAASPQKPPPVAATAPAAAPAAAPAPYDPRTAAAEKRSREMGYHVETRHGEQFYCRTTAPLGSRLTQKECLTADGMAQAVQMAEENQAAQRQGQICQGGGCTVH